MTRRRYDVVMKQLINALMSRLKSRATLSYPNSAAGFTALWGTIDTNLWGAADVSLSVRLTDGRSVWLYGDTFSGWNKFVHSTAIVQNGKRLHVSNGGRQLLPDDSKTEIYWIEQAQEVRPSVLYVTAAPMLIGSGGPWDFKRRDVRSRVAKVSFDSVGDAKFEGWVGYVEMPPQHTDFTVIGPNHFTYGKQKHPQFKMKSGKTLVTVCQNWDDAFINHFDNGKMRYSDFRPIFSEE